MSKLQHGLSYTPEYRAWQTMRHRCTQPTSPAWPNYGGRGIKICNRWLDSPANFLADVGPRPSSKHEIDRINNDGDYEPGNIRWATRSENDRNRRSNVWIEFRGERKTLTEWCEQFNLPMDTVAHRLKTWSVERALTTPVRKYGTKSVTA